VAGDNGTHPETVEYVLVPVDPDTGEVVLTDGYAVPVMMADVDQGLTVVGVPSDLEAGRKNALVKTLGERTRAAGADGRQFLVLDGELGVRWKFWRMIRRDRYDEDFDEARPGR
jgi:hypothetical protein